MGRAARRRGGALASPARGLTLASIVLHHLEHSRSLRVAWLLEELGLSYEVVKYARDPKSRRAPPELKQVHPLGKSPVLVIDGVAHAESGAILEHLVETYGAGRFKPTDPALLARYRFWMHYAEGSLMPPLFLKLIIGRIRKAPVPFFLKPVTKRIADGIDDGYARPEIAAHTAFIEHALTEYPWFAGPEFTAADVQMSYPLEASRARSGQALGPGIGAFLERAEARPARLAAEARVGKNELMR